MAFTQHGHHIPGSLDTGEIPLRVARCGGTSLCVPCMREATEWYHKNAPKPLIQDVLTQQGDYQPTPIMRFFESKHLPPILAAVASTFEDLAEEIDQHIPNGPEKSVALRKLLESKDAAVRASLDLV